MTFNPGVYNDKKNDLENILINLSQFGDPGAEKLEIKRNEEGVYYLHTTAKLTGFKRFCSFFYKPETKRAEIVAKFIFDFFNNNIKIIEEIRKNSDNSIILFKSVARVELLINKTAKKNIMGKVGGGIEPQHRCCLKKSCRTPRERYCCF